MLFRSGLIQSRPPLQKHVFSGHPAMQASSARYRHTKIIATLGPAMGCSPGTWLVVITNVLAGGKVVDTLQLLQVK